MAYTSFKMYSAIFLLSLALSAAATPTQGRWQRRAAFTLQNGLDAIALNNKFKTLTANSNCAGDSQLQNACVGDKFAQCVNGKFVVQGCAPGTVCAALPLVNSAGTSVTCTTAADRDARIAATGANNAGNNNGGTNNQAGNNNAGNTSVAGATTTSVQATSTGAATATATGAQATSTAGNTGDDSDPQKSLTLDPRVISKGFANDGQDVPTAGQIPSLTSVNNFINFCLTVPQLPLTNGEQITTGSCNTAPIGVIPSVDNMPSAKFVFPKNTETIAANKDFTIQMAIKNLDAGNFVNAKENYFAAPQTLNNQGQIVGHTHHVIEKLDSLDQTTPTDPKSFFFFKGVNTGAVNGVVTSDVTGGVPPGNYRLCSINSSSNHQPAIVPIAQHGSLDDCVYFTAQ